MTLYEYKALDEAEQRESLWEYGEFLMQRKEATFTVALYQLFSFYVELYYDSLDNIIKKERSFSSTELLQPYINSINLSRLFE